MLRVGTFYLLLQLRDDGPCLPALLKDWVLQGEKRLLHHSLAEGREGGRRGEGRGPYGQVTEDMVSKVQHSLALPFHHVLEVLHVALLVDLPRLQLHHFGPRGSHGVRVQTAEWPGKMTSLSAILSAQHHMN